MAWSEAVYRRDCDDRTRLYTHMRFSERELPMLQFSTSATVALKGAIPNDADAVAVFIHKQSKANDADLARLAEPERTTLNDLLDNQIVTGKSNELSVHLLDPESGRRLIVIGLGNRQKFS